MAESRLGAARLYAPETGGSAATLALVVVFRSAFAYNSGIAKRRPDPFTTGTLPTYGTQLLPDIGTHGGGATAAIFIMQCLTETVDGLISDYLRVNGECCQ